MKKLDCMIEGCIHYVKNNLYCKKTKLIYDHKFNDLNILPTINEIGSVIPNPCGYGTGMEDSGINGGGMIDAMLTRLKITGAAEDREFLHELVDGLLLNAEAGKDGFFPRSRTHYDGISHYIDSSRDQYTLFLYAMHRLIKCEEATAEEMVRITRAVRGIADRALKNVRAETGYDLLREDGGPSLNCVMWGENVCNHEITRLPMIYLLAYSLTNDEKYEKEYMALREEACKRLLPMTEYFHIYCLAQMEMSLAVLIDLEKDNVYREKYLYAMKEAAKFCYEKIGGINSILSSLVDFRGEYVSFRDLPLERSAYKSHVYGELPNYHPKRDGFEVFFDYQDGANVLFCVALASADEYVGDSYSLFYDSLSRIDLEKHITGAPVQYVQAYYAYLRMGRYE